MQYDQAQREDQSSSRSSWEDDPTVHRPRIQTLKVLKVELEEEIEEASWFYQVLKHVGWVIIFILAQIGFQWLTQTRKRSSAVFMGRLQ